MIHIQGAGFGSNPFVVFDIGESDETVASPLADPSPTATDIFATVPDLSLGSHALRVANLNAGCETSNFPFTVTEKTSCGLVGIEIGLPALAAGRRMRRKRRSS